MAGIFCHPPHPHTHTDHPIDFINPDSHLLGEKIVGKSEYQNIKRKYNDLQKMNWWENVEPSIPMIRSRENPITFELSLSLRPYCRH